MVRQGACFCCAPTYYPSRYETSCRRGACGHRKPAREARRASQTPARNRARRRAAASGPRSASPPEFVAPPPLEFFNGIGGFDQDGREYVTVLDGDQVTPAPWVNVVANPSFGFQVSAEGSGYTWSVNSRENQLTPRSNDPVSDSPGEVIYVRDEDSGEYGRRRLFPSATTRPDILPDTAKGTAGSSMRRTDCARSPAICAARRFRQDLPPKDQERLRPPAASIDNRLCGVGARTFARRLRTLCRHRDRSQNRRDACTQSVAHGVRLACGLCRSGRPAKFMVRRSHGVHRPQRQFRFAGRARKPGAAVQSRRRGPRSVRRAANRCRIPPNGEVEITFLLGEAATGAEARRWSSDIAQPISTRSSAT